MDKKPKPPESVEVFYNTQDGSYLYKLQGEYVCLKLGDVRRHMRALGLREDIFFDGQRECDWPMYNAQVNRRVYYAGALGGHRVGTFKDGSNRVFLVTEEARGVFDKLGKPEEPGLFKSFLMELLGEEQGVRVCYWLAIALESLRKGDFRPGQVCVFAGPVQCGKSLLQYLITELLGGRGGNPMRYMMEDTTFNDDFATCEHWFIEEPKTTTDIRTRLAFGNAIKECFTNRDFSVHPKGKRATPLPLFRRGTISLNDEPELLQVLPPFNGSVDDKLNLFKCEMVVKAFAPFRSPKDGKLDRASLWAAFVAEIPTVRAWLLKGFRTVPQDLRDDRCGITYFHHPEILAHLRSFAPEVRLLELVDLVCFKDRQPDDLSNWIGKAMDLEGELRKSDFGFEAEKILRGGSRTGTYLSRLMKSNPERISHRKLNGYTVWTIKPPAVEQPADDETKPLL
jgi:hypothetical protein